MKYQITRKQCAGLIHGVCDGCGGELKPLKTVDNSDNPTYWAGCEKCSKYCWGVDEKVYSIAKELVEKRGWNPYHHMHEEDYKTAEEKLYFKQSQIAGAVCLVNDVFRVMQEISNLTGEKGV